MFSVFNQSRMPFRPTQENINRIRELIGLNRGNAAIARDLECSSKTVKRWRVKIANEAAGMFFFSVDSEYFSS